MVVFRMALMCCPAGNYMCMFINIYIYVCVCYITLVKLVKLCQTSVLTSCLNQRLHTSAKKAASRLTPAPPRFERAAPCRDPSRSHGRSHGLRTYSSVPLLASQGLHDHEFATSAVKGRPKKGGGCHAVKDKNPALALHTAFVLHPGQGQLGQKRSGATQSLVTNPIIYAQTRAPHLAYDAFIQWSTLC